MNEAQSFLDNLGLTPEQAATMLREAEYEQIHVIKNNIYLDLAYIQDYYLGMLLAILQSPEEYKYVYDQIPEYNERIQNGCAKYFPDLNVTEEQLFDFVKDPQYTVNLLRTAPITSGYSTLKEVWLSLMDHNQLIGEPNIKYNVFVNIYPMTFSSKVHSKDALDKIRTIIKDRIKYFNSNCKVYVVDFPTKDISLKMFKDMHAFLIMDLQSLLEDKKKEEWLLVKGKMEHTLFLCPRRHEHQLEFETQQDIDDMFHNGEVTMKLVCDFHYDDPIILLEKDIPPEDVMDSTEKED